MDKLKELLSMDPCYEQHIVSIKNIYEEHMFSIIIPALYEGFQSMYKHAYESELKFITATKRNPNIVNPGILVIFQTFIKEIPNLSTHKIRNETDRIKSSTKSADVFDDLIKAVCKANIILLTYNIDHKRKDLLCTKYHENIIIHDFIHSCYIQCARSFYGYSELFYHKQDSIVLNQNKRTCHKIIKEAIKEAIRLMLPMKEILLEYNTQKYEQKEIIHNIQSLQPNVIGQFDNSANANQNGFMNVNSMLIRDLQKNQTNEHSLLEDGFDQNDQNDQNDPNDPNYNDENTFGQYKNHKPNDKDYSLLLSSKSNSEHLQHDSKNSEKNPDNCVINTRIDTNNNNASDYKKDLSKQLTDRDKDNILTASDRGLKMIDISSAITKKGVASAYFIESLPEIKNRVNEYRKERNGKKTITNANDISKTKEDKLSVNDISKTKEDKLSVNNISKTKEEKLSENDEDIQITRTVSDTMRNEKNKDLKNNTVKRKNDFIDNVLQ